jgi:hypothetical protein
MIILFHTIRAVVVKTGVTPRFTFWATLLEEFWMASHRNKCLGNRRSGKCC